MGREVGGATLLWLLPFMTAYFQTQVNLPVLKPFLLGPLDRRCVVRNRKSISGRPTIKCSLCAGSPWAHLWND